MRRFGVVAGSGGVITVYWSCIASSDGYTATQTAVQEAAPHGVCGVLVTEAQALTILLARALMLPRMPAEEAEPVSPVLCLEEVVLRGWCCFAINIKER